MMSYKSILVCLDEHRTNASLMKVSADLAFKLDAKAVGIAVSQPLLIGSENVYVPADVFDDHYKKTEARMLALEASFEQAMTHAQADFGWHSKITIQPHVQYVSSYSRSYDLLMVSIRESHSIEPGVEKNSENTSDIAGELVLLSGRPVLLVPNDVETLELNSALICWQDTKEARRALADAIPLLQKCAQVRLLELYKKDQYETSNSNLSQLTKWLLSHGIHALPVTLESNGNDAEQLQAYAGEYEVDLLIGGAFGHSRIREWMFGGVTRNLFFHGAQCALISH
jgi:nucleotide-binding universal stress UspA family protein